MTVVYKAADVAVGDEVAYPGRLRWNSERSRRDWLRITRIDDDGLHGHRVHPEGWERERAVEYCVYSRQLADNGVEIDREAPYE